MGIWGKILLALGFVAAASAEKPVNLSPSVQQPWDPSLNPDQPSAIPQLPEIGEQSLSSGMTSAQYEQPDLSATQNMNSVVKELRVFNTINRLRSLGVVPCKVTVFFNLDGSSSVSSIIPFSEQRDAGHDILQIVNPAQSAAKIFSDYVEDVFDFRSGLTLAQRLSAMSNLQPLEGGTRLDLAFEAWERTVNTMTLPLSMPLVFVFEGDCATDPGTGPSPRGDAAFAARNRIIARVGAENVRFVIIRNAGQDTDQNIIDRSLVLAERLATPGDYYKFDATQTLKAAVPEIADEICKSEVTLAPTVPVTNVPTSTPSQAPTLRTETPTSRTETPTETPTVSDTETPTGSPTAPPPPPPPTDFPWLAALTGLFFFIPRPVTNKRFVFVDNPAYAKEADRRFNAERTKIQSSNAALQKKYDNELADYQRKMKEFEASEKTPDRNNDVNKVPSKAPGINSGALQDYYIPSKPLFEGRPQNAYVRDPNGDRQIPTPPKLPILKKVPDEGDYKSKFDADPSMPSKQIPIVKLDREFKFGIPSIFYGLARQGMGIGPTVATVNEGITVRPEVALKKTRLQRLGDRVYKGLGIKSKQQKIAEGYNQFRDNRGPRGKKALDFAGRRVQGGKSVVTSVLTGELSNNNVGRGFTEWKNRRNPVVKGILNGTSAVVVNTTQFLYAGTLGGLGYLVARLFSPNAEFAGFTAKGNERGLTKHDLKQLETDPTLSAEQQLTEQKMKQKKDLPDRKAGYRAAWDYMRGGKNANVAQRNSQEIDPEDPNRNFDTRTGEFEGGFNVDPNAPGFSPVVFTEFQAAMTAYKTNKGPTTLKSERLYEDQDMTTILRARIEGTDALKERPDIGLVAPVAVGSLSGLIDDHRKEFPDQTTLLIPYNMGSNHWVGILLEFEADGKLKRAEYSDSLSGKTPAEVVTAINSLGKTKIKLEVKDLYKQKDTFNCGPCTIENLVIMATGSAMVDVSKLDATRIREKHKLSSNQIGVSSTRPSSM